MTGKNRRRNACLHSEQAQQQMFAADVRIFELVGFLGRKNERLLEVVSERHLDRRRHGESAMLHRSMS